MKQCGWRTHKTADKLIVKYTISHKLRVAKYKERINNE